MDNFWLGFEKRANMATSAAKEVMRVGKAGVRIAGPQQHIGSAYLKSMKDAMPKVKTPGLNASAQPVVKQAGLKDTLKDIIRIGKGDKVQLFGPSKHIGAKHVEEAQKHMQEVEKALKANPAKSMSDLAKKKYADPALTPRTTWRKAIGSES